jgi:hypothetical protein
MHRSIRLLSKPASILLLSAAAGSIASAALPQGPAAEPGVPGTVAPQSGDVRLADTLVNQDARGGSNQMLLSLAASPNAGFAAVWRDQRDGMLGLYLARLNARGELLEPERPIHQPHSGRRLDPSVALTKDNAGAVVWVSSGGVGNVPWVRTFDASGKWTSTDRPLAEREAGAKPQAREAGPRLPMIAALPHGGFAVAWTQAGQVIYQELERDGSPHGKTVRLAPSSPPAEAGVQVAVSNRGSVLCVWRTKSGNMAVHHGYSDTAPVNCGMGVLCRLITDPVGGFWGAFIVDERAVLRHLSIDGKPDRPDVKPISATVTGLDLALGDDYIALLAESASVPRGESRGARGGGERAGGGARGGADPERGAGGEGAAGGDSGGSSDRGAGGERAAAGDGSADSFAVYLLDREGRLQESQSAVHIPSPAAVLVRGPRIVSNGKRAFVAWTDQRNGDQDIFGRVFEPAAPRGPDVTGDPRLGAEARVNTDVASSDQSTPCIAGAGQFAVIAWQDSRDQYNRVFARPIAARGFSADEFPLPAPFGGAPAAPERNVCIQPAVAVRTDGQFAVQWKEMGGRFGGLRVQCFGADEKPLAAPVSIAGGQDISAHAIVALGEDRGYLIAWIGGGQGGGRDGKGGLNARRLALDGTLTPAVRLAEAQDGTLADLALAVLDDQRSIVAWSVHGAGDARSLRVRFVDSEGAAKSDEITIEPSPRKSDWQPCVAPAANNGFVMGWTSGAPSDRGRDVVARVFDARGKPAGPLLPISCLAYEQDYAQIVRLADKTYVIAWEDDISHYDHTYVRRIMPSGRELGPIVRLNELETKAVEDRTAPQIAILGDGLVGTWNDRRRSQGWDIYIRILGPRFDDAAKR